MNFCLFAERRNNKLPTARISYDTKNTLQNYKDFLITVKL